MIVDPCSSPSSTLAIDRTVSIMVEVIIYLVDLGSACLRLPRTIVRTLVPVAIVFPIFSYTSHVYRETSMPNLLARSKPVNWYANLTKEQPTKNYEQPCLVSPSSLVGVGDSLVPNSISAISSDGSQGLVAMVHYQG